MEKSLSKYLIASCAFIIIVVAAFSLSGCVAKTEDEYVFLQNRSTFYPEVAKQILPDFEIKPSFDKIFLNLERGYAAEAFDIQAIPAIDHGVANYWYPQYLATIVIAVDRDRTDVDIKGWSDLTSINEDIGMCHFGIDDSGVLNAISFAFEGQDFTYKSAVKLLEPINASGRLKLNTFEPPVLICYDYQAAFLKKNGANIEIIVPSEGTLSFEAGLLSKMPIEFSGDVEKTLLSYGFRLLNGQCDEEIYPAKGEYSRASLVLDYEHYSNVSLDYLRTLRRDIRHTRLYSGAEAREHQYLALLYLFIIVLWTSSVVRRAQQKSIKLGAIYACLIMVSWIVVRAVKFQTPQYIYWDRLLWFAYIGFSLLLMTTLLWIAIKIDNPQYDEFTPKWFFAIFAVNVVFTVFVLLNDFHNLVYTIDYNNINWRKEYRYGIAYYIITVVYILEFALSYLILLAKSMRNPNKKKTLVPIALFILALAYGWGYIAKVPIMAESDLTIVICFLALLFFEIAIQTGLFPVNTMYKELFTYSPLKMQILSVSGESVFMSESAPSIDAKVFECIKKAIPEPITQADNTLLYGSHIPGGYAVWQEDIGIIKHLEEMIEESVTKLISANRLLSEEEKIKRKLSEEVAKIKLMEQLETEIVEKTERLTIMIDNLSEAQDNSLEVAKIALLLCYIKRRCNLFFREKETNNLPASELIVYIDELSELSAHAGVKISPTSRIVNDIPVRQATLLYDFFYDVLVWATENEYTHMIQFMGVENGFIAMRLMVPNDDCNYQVDAGLKKAIHAEKGIIEIKDLDGAIGISLSFSAGTGGDINA